MNGPKQLALVMIAMALPVAHATSAGEPCEVTCPDGTFSEFEYCGADANNFCDDLFVYCYGLSGTCCGAYGGTGCSDRACEQAICSKDPFCCEIQWDQLCADPACSAGPSCDCDPIDPGLFPCGASVCGTLWAFDGTVDVDEFFVHMPGGGLLTWTVEAEMPVECSIFQFPCEDAFPPSQNSCPGVASASAIVSPKWGGGVRVRPLIKDGLPCDSLQNAYVATLTCNVCFTDIDNNGVTNVDDLLTVINGWGPCEKSPCASDVDRNQSTNVDDLLHVINRWGDCP